MIEERANDSIFFKDKPLKVCPFCGAEPYMDSCDRVITIGCFGCGYRRSFHGLVQNEIVTKVVASYKKGTEEPLEWYDKDAYEKAADAWNIRAMEGAEE